MAELVSETGCRVQVEYVPEVNFWDTPGVWLLLRMPRGDGRAASMVFLPHEAEWLADEVRARGRTVGWRPMAAGFEVRVFERPDPGMFEGMPGVYLLFRKPDYPGEGSLRLSLDEADTLVTAIGYALEDAEHDWEAQP